MNSVPERICFVKGCNKVLTGECCRLPSNLMRGVEILEFIGRDELILTPYEDLREICLMCKDHFEMVPDEPTAAKSETSNIMSEPKNSNNSNEGVRVNLATCHKIVPNMKQISPAVSNGSNKITYQIMPNMKQISPAVSNGSKIITYRVMPYSHSASSDSSSSESSAYQSDDNSSQGSTMICKLCDCKLNGIEHFRRHMKARHCGMFCDRCDKAFNSPNYLRTHQKWHCKKIY